MKLSLQFLLLVATLTLLSEVVARFTKFQLDGSFLISYFYITIVAGVFTLIAASYDNRNKREDR